MDTTEINGQDQTILIDQSITAKTEEQELLQQTPPVDPEEDEEEDDDDDDFPAEEDLEEDYGLDQDTGEPGLDTDEDEFELKRGHFSTLLSAK